MKSSPSSAWSALEETSTAIWVGVLLAGSLLCLFFAYAMAPGAAIDIGSGRDTAFVHGFSFRENLPSGGDFRWSGPRAEIRFWGLGNAEGELALVLAAPRPAGQAHVEVFGNGISLGKIQPGSEFARYAFPITRDVIGAGGDLMVTLTSDTFEQPPDDRQLGLQVDSASFHFQAMPILPAARSLYLTLIALLLFATLRAWSGSAFAGALAAELFILGSALAIIAYRVETAWFAEALFWLLAGIYAAAWLLARVLQRLDASLDRRTLRFLAAAMLLAFAVRMLWASGPGFIVDTQDYVVWSYKTVTYGLGSAYTALNGLWIVDQSPGLVYLLHGAGMLYRAVFSPDFLYPAVAGDPALRSLSTNPAFLADPAQRALLRMPSLLCDLVTGALIFAVARKRLSNRAAWLLAFGYWFNPAVLWNGAYWGQTDAIPALLVLAAFLLMDSRRMTWAFFAIGIAVVTKPQAVVYGPLLLAWAARDVLSGMPQRAPTDGAIPAAPRVPTRKEIGAILTTLVRQAALPGIVGVALILLPMVLTSAGGGMLAYFADTVGHHPIVSANAHNLWWFLTNGQIDVADTARLAPAVPISYRTFSLLLFGAAYLLILAQAWREGREGFFAAGALAGFCFFMLPTEIHENYGYTLLPLLVVALARDRNQILFYLAVSATMLANYALSDQSALATLRLDMLPQQLALARQANAAANVILLAGWGSYFFFGKRLPRLGLARTEMPRPAGPL